MISQWGPPWRFEEKKEVGWFAPDLEAQEGKKHSDTYRDTTCEKSTFCSGPHPLCSIIYLATPALPPMGTGPCSLAKGWSSPSQGFRTALLGTLQEGPNPSIMCTSYRVSTMSCPKHFSNPTNCWKLQPCVTSLHWNPDKHTLHFLPCLDRTR